MLKICNLYQYCGYCDNVQIIKNVASTLGWEQVSINNYTRTKSSIEHKGVFTLKVIIIKSHSLQL